MMIRNKIFTGPTLVSQYTIAAKQLWPKLMVVSGVEHIYVWAPEGVDVQKAIEQHFKRHSIEVPGV